jgi:hypothetical protein
MDDRCSGVGIWNGKNGGYPQGMILAHLLLSIHEDRF